MEYERKGITIMWQIENVKCPREHEMKLNSPVFTVDVMDGTKWTLGMFFFPTRSILLTIKREVEDEGPEEIGLHYEFSILSAIVPRRKSLIRKGSSFKFRKGQSCPQLTVIGKHKYPTSDIITIRCKIWRQLGSVSKNGHFFLRTRVRMEQCIFVGVVEHFSDLQEGEKKTLKTISSATGEKLMTVSLCLSSNLYPFLRGFSSEFERKLHFPVENSWLEIEINSADNQTERVFDFRLFVLDSSGRQSDLGKLERKFLKSNAIFSLPTLSKERLLNDAARYLPNDTLSLHFEMNFFPDKEHEEVERVEYEANSIAEEKQTDFASAVEILTRRKGNPCDTKLQTATETFPVHSHVLSAKSPVFEAMFKSNMKEAIQKRVRIDDVDAGTLKRMLVFLYSGTLEELEWKDAMELYSAADKYQILSLQEKCFTCLEQNVDLSNCCVLLILADMHQAEDLKIVVQNYITKNDIKILYSDEWRDLEKNFPQLVISYFRSRCLKNRVLTPY